ncbi:MAG TPA: FAD binding domain-containing protein [Jatrophihabitans sp.]|nr:FAD binding domain-containing protein [Jatrophihabitans sp.]
MTSVSAYWRPESLGQALELLDRPSAVVLGGGTKLSAAPSDAVVEVVDLQALRLNDIEPGERAAVSIGSAATLQQVADSDHVPAVVREAARREQPSGLRAQATIGGCIATGDAESELLAVLLVHDAVVTMAAGAGVVERPLDALLAHLPVPAKTILLGVTIATSGVAAVSRTARTPADKAIVAAAARRIRGVRYVALSGVAYRPVLADRVADLDPIGDFRGSSEYRRALAAIHLERVAEAIS